MTMQTENDRNINARCSLGKGEVDSSILSGSTRNARIIGHSDTSKLGLPAVPSRTPREHDASIRGKSVDSVHDRFAAAIDLAITLCMDCGMHPSEMIEVLKARAEWCASVDS